MGKRGSQPNQFTGSMRYDVTRYHQMTEKDGWTDWIRPLNPYKISCCDCGLVHNLEFCIDDNGNIVFRAGRNMRSTAQVRRHMKREVAR